MTLVYRILNLTKTSENKLFGKLTFYKVDIETTLQHYLYLGTSLGTVYFKSKKALLRSIFHFTKIKNILSDCYFQDLAHYLARKRF